MKKATAVLVFLCLFSFSACGATAGERTGPQEAARTAASSGWNAPKEESEGTAMAPKENGPNILVAYFSCTGATAGLAQAAAKQLGADLYEITPEEPYTQADLAYDADSRAGREQHDPDARPAIAGDVPELAQYTTVLIGYPIWHGQAPRIVSTFLERCDFSEKSLLPFCTSHSSGLGSSDTALHPLAADAHWLDGKRFAADASPEEISLWLMEQGLLPTAAPKAGVFDFDTRTVVLNSGYEMPINGLGTYSLRGDECRDAVTAALRSGVRLFDTAHAYGNERELGQALRASGVPRDEVFVITKLYPDQFADADAAIDEALEKLDLGYIDMMLLHHPGDGDVAAYRAMERAMAEGKIRSLGCI